MKIGASSWVCNVISEGYKIPLRRPPKQTKIPTNPTVSTEAFEVLIQEAKDLMLKGAVNVSQPEDGEYITSYFAVPKPRSPGKFRPILNLKCFNQSA